MFCLVFATCFYSVYDLTDTDNVALLELQVAALLILHLRFCWKYICVFVSFFCAFIAWPESWTRMRNYKPCPI